MILTSTDDMALMDSTKDGLQETTDRFCKYAAQSGLRSNIRKTEVTAAAKIHRSGRILRREQLIFLWKDHHGKVSQSVHSSRSGQFK